MSVPKTYIIKFIVDADSGCRRKLSQPIFVLECGIWIGWIKGAAYVIISTKRGSSCNRSSGPFGDTTKRYPQALHSDGAKLLEGQLVNEKSSKDQQRL
jgi:hypothetical protein